MTFGLRLMVRFERLLFFIEDVISPLFVKIKIKFVLILYIYTDFIHSSCNTLQFIVCIDCGRRHGVTKIQTA